MVAVTKRFFPAWAAPRFALGAGGIALSLWVGILAGGIAIPAGVLIGSFGAALILQALWLLPVRIDHDGITLWGGQRFLATEISGVSIAPWLLSRTGQEIPGFCVVLEMYGGHWLRTSLGYTNRPDAIRVVARISEELRIPIVDPEHEWEVIQDNDVPDVMEFISPRRRSKKTAWPISQ